MNRGNTKGLITASLPVSVGGRACAQGAEGVCSLTCQQPAPKNMVFSVFIFPDHLHMRVDPHLLNELMVPPFQNHPPSCSASLGDPAPYQEGGAVTRGRGPRAAGPTLHGKDWEY